MKKVVLVTFVLFVSFTSIAQYSTIVREDIKEADVPDAVKQAQRMQFYDGFVTGWKFHKKQNDIQGDKTYYVANFKKDGRLGNYSYYSEDGQLLAYLLHIDSGNLPGSIQENAAGNLNRSNIKSAELIDLENPQRQLYRVRLNNDGLLKYVYYDMRGNLMDKRDLPVALFAFI